MAKKVARFCPVLLLGACRRPASLSETLVLTSETWGLGWLRVWGQFGFVGIKCVRFGGLGLVALGVWNATLGISKAG